MKIIINVREIKILIFILLFSVPAISQTDTLDKNISDIEYIPIVSYDTDTGFGYGIKVFFFNQLNNRESFDVLLFNSTKGERYYKFVFSWPDLEHRQGKEYLWAIDVLAEYDKWIKYNYFGIGNASEFSSREHYTREPFELSATLSSGFTSYLVGQIRVKYLSMLSYNFKSDGMLEALPPKVNNPDINYISFTGSIRYDTRNSFINPVSGKVIQIDIEAAPLLFNTNTEFLMAAIWLQYYTNFLLKKLIFASRFGIRRVFGDQIPLQIHIPIGGNNTLRGLLQDRFLDKAAILINTELRFPIFYRFGGIAGIDAGRVAGSISKINFTNWAINPIVGLRYYMDKFVIRLDVGFGKNTTGIYFNFGHIF
jgi:outer membrane protein assembly factor BamA